MKGQEKSVKELMQEAGVTQKDLEKAKELLKKEDLYYWMMMGSLVVIAVWIVLKAAGIIQTPLWLQLLPYASAVFFAGTLAQSFRILQGDVRILKTEMRDVRERVVRLKEHTKHTDNDMHQMKRELSGFNADTAKKFSQNLPD